MFGKKKTWLWLIGIELDVFEVTNINEDQMVAVVLQAEAAN